MNTAVVDVDVTNFLTASSASKEALKIATLLKNLTVNSLIRGEVGVGKKTLANFILNSAIMVDGSNFDDVLNAISKNNKLIITNLQKINNLKLIAQLIQQNSIKLVATASENFEHKITNELFGITIDLPPLRDRLEDVEFLIDKFTKETYDLFGYNCDIHIDKQKLDLSSNALSLRRQIVLECLFDKIRDTELMRLMQRYLYGRLGSKNDYRNFLYLYEVPLIKAGLKRFGSQLQLAEKLGLNRNTLRKKITQNKEFMKNE